jgi:TolB protein
MLALALTLAVSMQNPPIIGDIEGGEFRPFPIAIPDFRTAGSDSLKAQSGVLSKQLRDDLDLSAVFQILNPKSFIDSDGVTLSTVKFPDWLNVGAAGLVKAVVKDSGDTVTIEVHAFEVAAGREGLSKTYTGQKSELRDLGHQIADDVFRYYTGEPGIFRTKLAAVKKVQGEKHLVVLDVDGYGERQVTKGGGLNLLPSWSPDGRSLLFTSYRGNNPDLYEIGVLGGEPKKISARPGLNTGGRVSPDGGKIALTLSQDGNSEIYLVDRAGTVLKRLTNQWGIDTSPSWSPDGRTIAFVSSRAGNPQIYLMDSSGDAGAKRLTFQGNYNQTPSYSPRGTHIAFTARDEFNRFDIFVIETATGKIARVTQDQGNNEEPTFSPNGRLLAFTSTRAGQRQVFVSNLDGTRQKQITFGGEYSSPSWGPFVK